MAGPRLSPAVRGSVGISLIALTAATATVLLHRERFERTLLALTEARLGFVAADVGARIQAGLDLGLDLPAMANVQAILDAEARGDPAIAAVEVRDAAGKVLFRSGTVASASAAGGGAAATAPPEPGRATGGEMDAAGPGDPGDGTPAGDQGGAGVAWFDAGSGLIAGRSRLVDIFGGEAGSLVLTYSRSSVGEATNAMTFLLARTALLVIVVAAAVAWLAAILALRDPTRDRGPAWDCPEAPAADGGSPAPGRGPAAGPVPRTPGAPA